MFGLNKKECDILNKLNSPVKIQDFLDKLKINFEENGDTCMSPRQVLNQKKCHCIEAAMLAALAFKVHKRKPLVVDLTASKDDFDHVIAVFKEKGKWGAVSKSNHAVLRYREPVYLSVRELVMSFFHEYFDNKGRKTLRSYSDPVDLIKKFGTEWITKDEDVWEVANYLAEIKHHAILTRSQKLRKANKIEIQAGKLVEWKN
jgi:hypothetical protein